MGIQAIDMGDGRLRVMRAGFDGKDRKMDMAGVTLAAFDAGMKAWHGGLLIQDAFPMLDADQREFLLTGITPDEWDAMFGDDEGEE